MRFLLDTMCGGLRSYLRMCGHDTAYALDRGVESDEDVIALAREEDRRVVTRDRQLAARAGDDAILLTERDPVEQLRELREAGVPLELQDEPTFCGACNGPLDRVAPDEALPEYVPDDQDPVWCCRDCGQHFWKVTHWDRVRETLESR